MTSFNPNDLPDDFPAQTPVILEDERRRRAFKTEGMHRSATGGLVTNVYNAVLLLEQFPDTSRLFGWNELSASIVVNRCIPGTLEPLENEPFDPDFHGTRVQRWMQDMGLQRIGLDTVLQAVRELARRNSFHPIREYLNSLEWDGVGRVDTWLSKYLGAADALYTRRVGCYFLLAMVSRAIHPGCKQDHMLVLEGAQGAGKSSALRILAGDEYFSDSLPPLKGAGDRDTQEHLRGLWLAEMPELDAMKKADATATKSFLSKKEDIYREPYAKGVKRYPRGCVLAGTTNSDSYLDDPSGHRRFWPVKVGAIDLEALKRDRDQLFAEAVLRYSDGERHYPTAEEERLLFAPEQKLREKEDDLWTEPIAAYLETVLKALPGPDGQEPDKTVTSIGVLAMALHISADQIGKLQQMRVAAILKKLGWQHCRDTSKRRWYLPAPGPNAQ